MVFILHPPVGAPIRLEYDNLNDAIVNDRTDMLSCIIVGCSDSFGWKAIDLDRNFVYVPESINENIREKLYGDSNEIQ